MRTASLKAYLEPGSDAAGQPSAEERGRLRDRYRGVLLGVAAGNGLGIPVEGWPRELIRRHYPGGLREIDEGERRRPWDDDLAQTALLAEALLEGETLDPRWLGERLLHWLRANGRGVGNLTMAVLESVQAGVPEKAAARMAWEERGRNAAGNGAIMRASPVALRWRRFPGRLVDDARESALVTHHDERCVWSAVALNAVLARLLHGGPVDLGTLSLLLESAGAPREVGEAMRVVQGRALADLALDHPQAMGYTLKALQAGLWCMAQPEDFEGVLVEVVNAGGDTDTNGAVAGAVMGCRVGAAAIPARWLASIADVDRLEWLADELLERSMEQPAP